MYMSTHRAGRGLVKPFLLNNQGKLNPGKRKDCLISQPVNGKLSHKFWCVIAKYESALRKWG